MKKTVLITMMAFTITFASAQNQREPRGDRPSPEQMIKKASEMLDLTDEQVQQWKDIHEKYAEDMKDRSKARETRKKMGEELEATLTEEQLVKFKEMRSKERPKRNDG